MKIVDEIRKFDLEMAFIGVEIAQLDGVEAINAGKSQVYAAEALGFRLFRTTERFVRAVFLDSCTIDRTPAGRSIDSKIRANDHKRVEEILKAGKPFLDWGNIKSTRALAELVFENGFPITDLFNPINSSLVDLQKIRNYIAHDSDEAKVSFESVLLNYLPQSPNPPQSAGELLLSRRAARSSKVASLLHGKLDQLSTIYLNL